MPATHIRHGIRIFYSLFVVYTVPKGRNTLDHSGAITSSHAGHSAHTPSVPSSFSYSTRSHALEIDSPQSGHRPRDDSSAFMERGMEGACDGVPPVRTCGILESKVWAWLSFERTGFPLKRAASSRGFQRCSEIRGPSVIDYQSNRQTTRD